MNLAPQIKSQRDAQLREVALKVREQTRFNVLDRETKPSDVFRLAQGVLDLLAEAEVGDLTT